MRFLRTLSTRRLAILLSTVLAVAVAAGVIAVTAFGGGGATPPPKPLADALHDAVTAARPVGITAQITFTNRLFPSGALLGQTGSALMSGASGRLWATNDGRGRLELQSDAGDVQIVWNGDKLTVYDASANTVYEATLPTQTDAGSDNSTPPSLDQITTWLTKLGAQASISDAQPENDAGQPAYKVTVSPKHDGGLLGSAELAWDAATGVPLSAAVYAQGSSAPVLELTATDISYGPVSSADVDVSPPSGAKVVDLGGKTTDHATGSAPQPTVTGVDAVQAAISFPLVAPDTLVGLPRKTVQLLDSSDSKGALIVYGEGLGALVVVERPAAAQGPGSGQLGALPKVSIDGASGHELATPLGTVLEFDRTGVSYLLAGSLPTAAAEAAARALG
jgi:outer membrane lipoprotein-sorting protein